MNNSPLCRQNQSDFCKALGLKSTWSPPRERPTHMNFTVAERTKINIQTSNTKKIINYKISKTYQTNSSKKLSKIKCLAICKRTKMRRSHTDPRRASKADNKQTTGTSFTAYNNDSSLSVLNCDLQSSGIADGSGNKGEKYRNKYNISQSSSPVDDKDSLQPKSDDFKSNDVLLGGYSNETSDFYILSDDELPDITISDSCQENAIGRKKNKSFLGDDNDKSISFNNFNTRNTAKNASRNMSSTTNKWKTNVSEIGQSRIEEHASPQISSTFSHCYIQENLNKDHSTSKSTNKPISNSNLTTNTYLPIGNSRNKRKLTACKSTTKPVSNVNIVPDINSHNRNISQSNAEQLTKRKDAVVQTDGSLRVVNQNSKETTKGMQNRSTFQDYYLCQNCDYKYLDMMSLVKHLLMRHSASMGKSNTSHHKQSVINIDDPAQPISSSNIESITNIENSKSVVTCKQNAISVAKDFIRPPISSVNVCQHKDSISSNIVKENGNPYCIPVAPNSFFKNPKPRNENSKNRNGNPKRKPGEPESNNTEPESNAEELESNTAEHEINTTGQESNTAEPDSNSAVAVNNTAESENNTAESESNTAEPENISVAESNTEKTKSNIENPKRSLVNPKISTKKLKVSTKKPKNSIKNSTNNSKKPKSSTMKPESSTEKSKRSTKTLIGISKKPQMKAEKRKSNTEKYKSSTKKYKSSNEKPKSSTKTPMSISEKLQSNAEKRKNNAEKYKSSTEKPKISTEKPKMSAEKSNSNTEKLKINTEKPKSSTEKPECSTEKPECSTENPESSTENPENRTKKPECITEKPESSSEKPESGTENPESSTEKPTSSTKKPKRSTEKPKRSTGKPKSSTEKSKSSTEKHKISNEKPKSSTNHNATVDSTNKVETSNEIDHIGKNNVSVDKYANKKSSKVNNALFDLCDIDSISCLVDHTREKSVLVNSSSEIGIEIAKNSRSSLDLSDIDQNLNSDKANTGEEEFKSPKRFIYNNETNCLTMADSPRSSRIQQVKDIIELVVKKYSSPPKQNNMNTSQKENTARNEYNIYNSGSISNNNSKSNKHMTIEKNILLENHISEFVFHNNTKEILVNNNENFEFEHSIETNVVPAEDSSMHVEEKPSSESLKVNRRKCTGEPDFENESSPLVKKDTNIITLRNKRKLLYINELNYISELPSLNIENESITNNDGSDRTIPIYSTLVSESDNVDQLQTKKTRSLLKTYRTESKCTKHKITLSNNIASENPQEDRLIAPISCELTQRNKDSMVTERKINKRFKSGDKNNESFGSDFTFHSPENESITNNILSLPSGTSLTTELDQPNSVDSLFDVKNLAIAKNHSSIINSRNKENTQMNIIYPTTSREYSPIIEQKYDVRDALLRAAFSKNVFSPEDCHLTDEEIDQLIRNCKPKGILKDKHSTIVDGAKKYECHNCPTNYDTIIELRQHFGKQHDKDRADYTCIFCFDSFNTANQLRRHLQNHRDILKYKCCVCESVFSNATDLQTHICEISDVALFQCDQCKRSFTSKYLLQNHITTHANDKPFKCKFCLMAYKYKGACDRHMKFAHGYEDLLKCDICNAAYKEAFALKMHMYKHQGIKSFACTQCDARFSDLVSLRQHMVKVGHNISE